MSTWIKLSPEETHHKYKIPWYLAKAKKNSFFGTNPMPGDPYHDGPWPLLAFLTGNDNREAVSFQICSVEFEFIYNVEAPNPLKEHLGGYLSLSKKEFEDLIYLLRLYASRLEKAVKHIRLQFRLIEYDELSSYYQDKESLPGNDTFHYLQLYNPAEEVAEERSITVIILSAQQPYNFQGNNPDAPLRFSVEFHKFLNSEMQDPFFSLSTPRVSKINLDKQGMLKLAKIMENVLTLRTK